jgi:hypothetical protein
LPASPAPIFAQDVLSVALVDAGSVLILSTVRWQLAISCCGVAFGPVSPVGTVELVGTVLAPADELLVVLVLLLPHPASNTAPATASASNVDTLRIIAAS